MEDQTFEKVDRSNRRMYGPKAILVCGYPPQEHEPLAEALSQIGFADRPAIFATDDDVERTLLEVLSSDDRSGMGKLSRMPRAIVMSGFTQEELHLLMNAYKKAGLPGQLWATLTPVSESWTLKTLLTELAKEAEAFRKGNQ